MSEVECRLGWPESPMFKAVPEEYNKVQPLFHLMLALETLLTYANMPDEGLKMYERDVCRYFWMLGEEEGSELLMASLLQELPTLYRLIKKENSEKLQKLVHNPFSTPRTHPDEKYLASQIRLVIVHTELIYTYKDRGDKYQDNVDVSTSCVKSCLEEVQNLIVYKDAPLGDAITNWLTNNTSLVKEIAGGKDV